YSCRAGPETEHHRRFSLNRPVLLLLALAIAPRVADAQRVVLVSVDGLRPDFYLHPGEHGVELPALRAMVADGVYAEEVESVYPTLTYSPHTSIVTGALPARHGIVNDTLFDGKGRFDDWYWRADAIRGKTLWDVAPGTTAAILWPATVGADIDLNFPDFWIPGDSRPWGDAMAGVATPQLLKEIGPVPAKPFDEERLEDLLFRSAELVLETHRPSLLLLHPIDTDAQQHRHGREQQDVASAFERTDRALGRLRARIAALGLADETLFAVTGDHGFFQTHTSIHLNARLREAGLLEVGRDGAVSSYRALAWPSGGSCFLMLRDRKDNRSRKEVETLVEEMLAGPLGGAMSLVPRSELDRLGAVPEALFALDAGEGYAFGKNLEGPLLSPSHDSGYHGSLPHHPKMKTGFLMAGPRVRRGLAVPRMRLIDIAPTIAFWAGWDLPEADGLALRELFEGR
ncbi:MAG TPA: alkaline phosphatase family protein, partial [Vicinamibacteria bacterium]|nr:alkaline phosphatase family protein [Vicinamibacteria bacterium]